MQSGESASNMFRVILIPADSSKDVKEISLVKEFHWIDRICEILNCKALDYVWPALTQKSQRGGCLLVDRYWYQCDKKNHKNDRATQIYRRDIFGDVVLADEYYVDEDENGKPLPQGYSVYNDITVEVYNDFFEKCANYPHPRDVLSNYLRSVPKGSAKEFPPVYKAQDWKGKTPKQLLMEYQQGCKQSNPPQYSRLVCDDASSFLCEVTISAHAGTQFVGTVPSKTRKEADHNAALAALVFLNNLWSSGQLDELDDSDDLLEPLDESSANNNNNKTNDNENNNSHGNHINNNNTNNDNNSNIKNNTSNNGLEQSKFPIEDVSGDGCVLKQILKEGQGEVIPANSRVVVNYEGFLKDGTRIDSSRDRNEPYSFKLGKNRVLPCWEYAVASMKRNELARIISSPEYAYGPCGCPPRIPPASVLVYEIEVMSAESLDDQKLNATQNISIGDRISRAAAEKEAGNVWFQKEAHRQALKCYHKGLEWLAIKKLRDCNSQQENQSNKLLLQLHLNCAAVCIHLTKWDRVIQHCNTALLLDPFNVKALYRRGKAYCVTNELPQAREDFMSALKLDSNNNECKLELQKLKEKQVVLDQQEKALYNRMLSSTSA